MLVSSTIHSKSLSKFCSATEKIEQFCRDAGLVKDLDGEGYHGFHPNWEIYFEVISFKKLHTNAELRNKILF